MEPGIPGFTIVDEAGNVVADNPEPNVPVGRRSYSATGEQIDRSTTKRKASTHDYLLRSPKGLWKAFSRKCDQEGLTIRETILFLVKDWVTGRIEIEDLQTRKVR